MYIPKHFKEEDIDKIFSFISEYNFGILLTSEDDAIKGTHLPFIPTLEGSTIHLTTHLAAANDQLQQLSAKKECLVIFNGPHAYVSPSLYAEQQNVPTWNFIAVHLYGRHTIIEDFEAKKDILERSIQSFEAAYFEQWTKLDTKYRDKLINGMTGLEINIDRIEAKYKLSQNKSAATRKSVTDHFLEDGQDIGSFMQE